MQPRAIAAPRRVGMAWLVFFGLLLLLVFARNIAEYVIDYEWWREVGHVQTFLDMLAYTIIPAKVGLLIAFPLLLFAHRHGVHAAGFRVRDHLWYLRISTVFLLLLAWIISSATVDTWSVVRYLGGRNLTIAQGFADPVFQLPLSFYFFHLPFYDVILRFLLTLSIIAAIVHWVAARGWYVASRMRPGERQFDFDLRDFYLSSILDSLFLRFVMALFLLALAAQLVISRYDMMHDDHGFMVGIDYVAEHVRIPLQWASIAACLLGAVLILLNQFRLARWLALILLLRLFVPGIVNAVYVKPNEISLQRPYIQRHIAATRAAYGLDGSAREVQFPTQTDAGIDVERHRPLLDNVRLWDWRPFHDTITQIQALRPYYSFAGTDVDRYVIDGKLRQMLLTPRELDIRQLQDARTRWINPHFIYTHGYGLVMAEANEMTRDGLPQPLIQNAPPEVRNASLKLTRPELYYGEITHEPVFVRTAQPEFNYPSGSENVHSRYDGRGGFPISSLFLRTMAMLSEGEPNILLTGYLQPESRMMIHRDVRERLEHLASFLDWDSDPYLVLTSEGRLVWIVDGYTSSDRHPYSKLSSMREWGQVNYLRNSVKATVDAYDGSIHLYIFAPEDPLIQAWSRLFPALLEPSSSMPEELRAHARYPETLFSVQAFVYRTFHMRDPEAFYNKEDVWDVARNRYGQEARPEAVSPTYVVATLPGEQQPEFLLLQPFTPRGKDNLIGVMAARCDGPHLGEIVVLQLTKQALVFGPMQIDARIDQDQNISKDLTLWNQQGSRVLRGQMLVLPADNSFLYFEPIYIQASEARMPQLKKVVLASGNNLIYTDTYEQAVAALKGNSAIGPPTAKVASSSQPQNAPTSPDVKLDPRLESVRRHLARYRELSAQGKWAEAGRELEAVEAAVKP